MGADAQSLERREVALHQRLGSRDMRLFARIKPPRLADLRSDQEAGEIFARIVRIKLAHQRQRARAEQEAEQAGLRLAARRRRAALDPERERRLRRSSAGAALAKAPATVWSRSAANNSPVMKVLNATTRSPSIFAHFECEPGSTMSRAPAVGDAEDFRLLAPHHVRRPASSA